MEYKRSSHVEEEKEEEEEEGDEEEEEEDDEEEARGHRYTTAAAAPVGAPQQQQVHAQALGLGSHASLMDAAAFSRPRLPPNSSLVTQPPLPPPGFMPAQRQPQLHPRRAERERERAAGAPHPQPRRHQEGARNGVLGRGNVPPPASTLALTPGAGAVGPVEAAQWRYRECLRNHAARLGAHVLDGCCEFMPSAGDGAAALACAACGCHRSFHRREAVPGAAAAAVAVSPSPTPTANSSRVMPLLLAPPHMQTRPYVPVSPSSAPAALTESSSEELRGPAPAAAHPAPPPTLPPHAQLAVGGSASAPPAPSKKRFRTKFTADQKDRMREFAHRLGWRIHKPDSDAVDALCAQVGVSRRVLKVWMHNNKHLAKIPPSPPSSQLPPPPPPHRHDHHPPPPPHHIHLHQPPPPPPPQQQQQHDA